MNNSDVPDRRFSFPLIAILAAATVTLVAVIVGIASPPSFSGPELASVESVGVDNSAAKEIAGLLVESEGCFFLRVEGRDAFAIWPAGFSRVNGAVVSPDGASLAAGAEVVGTGSMYPRSGVVESEYLKRLTATCMGTTSDELVVVVFSVGLAGQ